MTAELWASNTGRVTCRAHGGAYFTAYLAAHPGARRFTTPLDAWERVTDEERAEWLAEMGEAMHCESCPPAEGTRARELYDGTDEPTEQEEFLIEMGGVEMLEDED